ncbi:methyltransferase domain-containing protein [Nonomuraea sp. K274]|uniref:Methyltransferase domain-containing protein n=1 Tax=Nonomuraea cypriaca TaxID=1187855 RepID=A0A931F5B7_9ACTN|nr:methyltransferase [Nonomuraea cypriaca]MBF8191916.1 methyltransferase domain-containing protein [Nonomuraea cypriaca]
MTSTAVDTSKPSGIIRLANSFCDAKALLTAVELGLFSTLHGSEAGVEVIRERLGLHGRGLSDWLDLLVELNLLEREDGRYRNSPGADRYLVRGAEPYIGGFIERSNRNLYPAWGRLSEALRTGESQSGSHFDAVVENPKILAQFINSMDALTRTLGPQLIEAYDGWGGYGSVLDVGGCRGGLAAQIVKAHSHLEGNVFDLPQMAPFAAELAAEQGLTGKVTFHGGSFFSDPLPSADIVVLGHVLHDWSAEQRKFLVEKAYDAVNPGGVLLVYDRMLDRASSRIENLVISLDMLLVTDGGSEYTVGELRSHIEGAGFASAEERLLGDDDTLVIAHKAS